jgi:putative membrane protein
MKFLINLLAITFLAGIYSANAQSNLSDPEVAAVAVAANQIDIKNGELAKKKSKNSDVLNFAETMIRDHNAVLGQASDLVKKLNVTPKENSLSQKLNSDADATRKSLSSKSGAAFDKAYVDNEVAYHKAVIDAVKNVLIPDTDNAELKQLLTDVLPALDTHLEHAQMLQKKMK